MIFLQCSACGQEYKTVDMFLRAANEKEIQYAISRGFSSTNNVSLFQMGDTIERCPECSEPFDEPIRIEMAPAEHS